MVCAQHRCKTALAAGRQGHSHARVPMVCCMAAVIDMAGLCGCSRAMLWRLRSSSSSAVVTDSVSLRRCRAIAPNPAAMQHPKLIA